MALTSEQQRVMREGWLSAHPRYPMEQCALDAAGAALLEYEARNLWHSMDEKPETWLRVIVSDLKPEPSVSSRVATQRVAFVDIDGNWSTRLNGKISQLSLVNLDLRWRHWEWPLTTRPAPAEGAKGEAPRSQESNGCLCGGYVSENGYCPVHMPEPAALRAESPQPDAWNEALWRKAAWNRITWPCDRTDFLAWRLREGGEGIEVLAYNYATLQIPSGHGLFYILDAPSLEAIGGPEPAAPRAELQDVVEEMIRVHDGALSDNLTYKAAMTAAEVVANAARDKQWEQAIRIEVGDLGSGIPEIEERIRRIRIRLTSRGKETNHGRS